MATTRTQFVCSACGGSAVKWQGQCPHCGAWNALIETRTEPGPQRRRAAAASAAAAVPISDVTATEPKRLYTGIEEFDRVLGGGLVDGGVVLIGGDPGIGKSTLLLQALSRVAATEAVLYVSGEESAPQVALRAQRLSIEAAGLPRLKVLAEIELETIVAAIEAEKPRVVVVDSIQTLFTPTLSSAPGSVSQVRECAASLTRLAKRSGVTVILVGHVTKEGALAGPRVLEHMVDTVLYFEGDTHSAYRLVRAFKNRFGAIHELGVFAMTDRGLRGVSNPSALFLSQQGDGKGGLVAGSCVMVTQEGSRPMLVEIQALVDAAHVPNPRRLCVGVDPQRLAMLLAVLSRHAGVASYDQDVFVNAVGGVRIDEPASDLAVALAVLSSIRNRPLPRALAVFGEVGLAGEIRPAARGLERLREAAKIGFSTALIPKANAPRKPIEGLEVIAVESLSEAISELRLR
ncbi:MAG TPA: DNA repair protein RadA [Burkholderiaceae bacterium]|nr:DNA repair protein RadA [Burkholderiaceae bacterium]